jgi:CRP/FNR family transcriptional regulator, cyclic AMP receptor protein
MGGSNAFRSNGDERRSAGHIYCIRGRARLGRPSNAPGKSEDAFPEILKSLNPGDNLAANAAPRSRSDGFALRQKRQLEISFLSRLVLKASSRATARLKAASNSSQILVLMAIFARLGSRAGFPSAFTCAGPIDGTILFGAAVLLEIGVPQDKTSDVRHFPSSKLAVLRKHPIFCDLDSEAFDQLCRYAKHATLKRGATIVSKGDPGNSLIAVISGTVKISISSPDGRSAILNLIGPGEIFGEVAVLDGKARTADATASTNCEIVVIDRREFLPFVRSQPALAMKFIELLCARLRWTSDQVEEVILQDLPGRLASALLRLIERHQPTQVRRTIAVTQQELSEMVGMTRESINKQLRAWAARDWVRLEHGAIMVLDVASLQELAGTAPGHS